MRQRWVILLLMWVGVLGVSNAQDPADWSVWVYADETGQAIQVNGAGEVLNELILPVPAEYAPNSYDYSIGMAVSQDGTRLAYRVSGFNVDGLGLATVIVYDVLADEVLLTFSPPIVPNGDAFDIAPTVRLFSDNGGALAYSYATGDSEATQAWEMLVLDIFTGDATATLGSRDDVIAAQRFELENAPYLLPVIHNYSGTQVDFTLFPYLTGTNLPTDSFQWNVISGRVNLAQRYPTITSDTLPSTGEAIMPTVDDRVPYDVDFAPYLNALHVFRPDLAARVPFFGTTTVDIFDAYFAQNGERVVVVGESLLDFSQVWLIVDRNGVSRVLSNIRAAGEQVRGTPDGFAYVLAGESPVLINANTRGDSIEQAPLWTGTPNVAYVPIWSTPPTDEAYPAWAQLAPPVFAAQTILGVGQGGGGDDDPPSEGISPNQVPTPRIDPSGVLTVQGVAVINTTGGDRLNMRADPGLAGGVIARVESGSRVVILDGPRALDGFVWWQVRLATGLIGWVVESADGVDTLLPAG